ncbi:MAG: beta-lactamase family protein [Clostridia bacterium]|nr:beta-lactamase family protein [Clostridia bacterium]
MDFSNLRVFLDSLVEGIIPGVDLTVYIRHKPVFRHMAGMSDKEKGTKMTGNETYFGYSVTKLLTCVCALTLFEKGAFLMTDPIREYLPEFSDMQVAVIDPAGKINLRPAKRDITFRDLFTMTAGLDYNLTTKEISEVVSNTNGKAPTREIMRAIAKSPLSFDPGERWQYSLCHDVLGGLIEVISGMKFETFMKKTLFEPLEMKSSAMHLSDALKSRLAMQYLNENEKGVNPIGTLNPFVLGSEYDSGGAGLITTVDDYIRFADMLAMGGVGMTGERILSKASIDLMRTNHLNDVQMKDFNWIQMSGYGYGLGVRTMVDRTRGSLSPVGEFGWGGAAGAYVLIDPEREMSVYFAEHMRNSLEPFVHPRIRNILYTCLEA